MERCYRQFDTVQTLSGQLVPVLMCPDDGTLVLDTSIHDRFHEDVEKNGSIGALWRQRSENRRRPVI